MPKIPCVKVTRPDTHGNLWCLYESAKFNATDEFDGAEVGEQIVLEYCEMTREELDKIPEFTGW